MSDKSSNPSNALALVRPLSKTLDASYTRPADTSAYTAGDVLAQSTSAATILSFTNAAREGGGGGIIQNAVMIDSSAQSTKPWIELYLFDTAPAMQNDNVAWAPSDSELEKCLGVLVFDGTVTNAFKTTSNGGLVATGAVSLSYQCASGSTTLYGIAVVRNAYTPTSAEKFNFRLSVIQD